MNRWFDRNGSVLNMMIIKSLMSIIGSMRII